MATVIPFQGILYNPEKIADLSQVVTPPYDVISPVEQQGYYDRHPNNVVRLDFGKKFTEDNDENNVNARAARHFQDWIAEKVLVRDPAPALYLTTVTFPMDGRLITRYGMVALVKLEPFEKRIVLPHEKTFSKVKSERLDLMKACHANFSQIFSLYSDREGILDLLKEAVASTEPLFDIRDDKKDRHRFWRIGDPTVHETVTRLMQDKRLFIADGHHRYETALNYRNWRRENDPTFTDDHPANYVMMYLCSMEDPGLVVLPAHRMLIDLEKEHLDGFFDQAGDYFDVTDISFSEETRQAAQGTLMERLKASDSGNSMGVYIRGMNRFLHLVLKEGVMERKFGDRIPDSLRQLDVTVLTRLVFMELLGFDSQRLDDEKRIAYSSDADKAVESVFSGGSDACFILNPTRIEQVREIAEEGQTMPRKTTYFYPKALTGQVVNSLNPE